MAITKIKVENLTVFEEMEMNVEANVNVIIGENGTGKTHLLKFIYMTLTSSINDTSGMIIARPFGKWNFSPRRNPELELSQFKLLFEDEYREFKIYPISNILKLENETEITQVQWQQSIEKSNNDPFSKGKEKIVFIPGKDMLTHSPGFLSMVREWKMPFDEVLVDIVSKASLPELREIPKLAKNIKPQLEKIMDGIVVIENDEFFILKKDGQKISFSVEAEGIKKIGLLWKLLMTGNITEESILLWDEPEANMNPKLIPVLAEIILELGRNGVQIFLATHDDLLSEYIEVLMSEKDSVSFHALYKTENGVKCETETKFTLLEKNAIVDESLRLYEKTVEKGLE